MVWCPLFRKIMEIRHLRLAQKTRTCVRKPVNLLQTARKQPFLRTKEARCGWVLLATVAGPAAFCPRTRA